MLELEKILEEINEEIKSSIAFSSVFTDGLCRVRNIIRKHMNDGWISVEERLPKVAGDIDDDNCPEFNVTIDGVDKATTLKCSSDGTFFDDNGYVYPVIAWRPLPEPYKPKQPETRKYTICSCCWSIDQCSDCPNNPERSENDQ